MPNTPTCRLTVLADGLSLDGVPVQLGGTAETRGALLAILADLIAHPGVWRSGSEIAEVAEAAPGGPVIDHRRIYRYLKHLPDAVRKLIDSDTRKGYTLLQKAWRK